MASNMFDDCEALSQTNESSDSDFSLIKITTDSNIQKSLRSKMNLLNMPPGDTISAKRKRINDSAEETPQTNGNAMGMQIPPEYLLLLLLKSRIAACDASEQYALTQIHTTFNRSSSFSRSTTKDQLIESLFE